MKTGIVLTALLFSSATAVFAQKTETIVLRKEPNQGQTVIEIKDGQILIDGKQVSTYPKGRNEVAKKIVIDAAHDAPEWSTWSGKDHKSGDRAVLGVLTAPDEKPGALITEVQTGSAAEKAGLQAGDRILAINETGIGHPEALVAAIGALKQGETVKVRYERDGKTAATTAKLQSAPAAVAPFSGDMPFGGQQMPNGMLFPPGQMPSFSPEDLQELQQLMEQFQMPAEGPKLGIDVEENNAGNGLLITGVAEGSPAGKAGLKAGDILTHWNGNVISNISTLKQQVQGAKQDKNIEVRYTRGGKSLTTQVLFRAPAKKAQL